VRTIRNLLKRLGMKLSAGRSTESFAGKCRRHLAESTELAPMEPLLVVIGSSNAQIQELAFVLSTIPEPGEYALAVAFVAMTWVGLRRRRKLAD
jgi:hypothetical protein